MEINKTPEQLDGTGNSDSERLSSNRETLSIRNAVEGEHAGIWELVFSSYREFGPKMKPEDWNQMRTNLKKLVEGATLHQLLVAELVGRKVGTVSYYPAGSIPGAAGFTRFPSQWAVMRVLAVQPESRGRGFGRQLAEEVIDRARDDGAATMGLHTSELMTTATGMYQRMGFELQENFTHLGLKFGLYRLSL
ncbi:MAG: GNAT family N-acetyltransferase [Actinomycetota bacterium]